MVPQSASRRAQRGMALLALLAVAVMVFAYVLVSRLNAASQFVGIDREHNAKVLAQAKRALIGWMAINAAQTDRNPGRLPCPEAVNSIATSSEGVSAPQIALPGPPPVSATPDCATVGRLPWRTLGLDKLLDAASEPLWYVVSPGWRLQNSSTLLNINSDRGGAMAIDGAAAPEVVALIIAPGPAMNVQAATGCVPQAQARAAPAPAMDPLDYIECFDAAAPAPAFSTTGPAASFNDQVLRVTTADLIPALEAAVADRMQREIAPVLRNVYAAPNWGLTGTARVFPYAAPFADPAIAAYKGEGIVPTTQGLLPFNYSLGCPGPPDPRCDPLFVRWSATVPTVTLDGTNVFPCTFTSPSTVECTGTYLALGAIQLRFDGVVNNVAMALRTLDPSRITVQYRSLLLFWASAATTTSGTLRSDGHADIRADATIPGLLGLSYEFLVNADIGVVTDHPLLDASSTGPGSTGWFVRNEWYRLTHYAVSVKNTASNLPNSCAGANCLRIDFPVSTQNNVRSLLVLAGRSINGTARPSATLANYLEFGNNNGDRIYEQNPISRVLTAAKAPFNDRVLVVDSN